MRAVAERTGGRVLSVGVPDDKFWSVSTWRSLCKSSADTIAGLSTTFSEILVLAVDVPFLHLRFPNDSFDVVLSNVAIHNIKGARQREAAIDEALRVLRPGGRLMIADIFGADRYAQRLRARQVRDVERRGLGWRMWWSGPWVRTTLITATKPSSVPDEQRPDHLTV